MRHAIILAAILAACDPFPPDVPVDPVDPPADSGEPDGSSTFPDGWWCFTATDTSGHPAGRCRKFEAACETVRAQSASYGVHDVEAACAHQDIAFGGAFVGAEPEPGHAIHLLRPTLGACDAMTALVADFGLVYQGNGVFDPADDIVPCWEDEG